MTARFGKGVPPCSREANTEPRGAERSKVQMAALGINGAVPTGFKRLFMSHPPLEERIDALKRANGLA